MSATKIAIMGAGLSGLALALALHQQGIEVTAYEQQSAPLDIGGAIMLSPNALKILDKLGVFERMEPRSYKFEESYFLSQDNKLMDVFEFGSVAKYGYSGIRVYRFELINILLDLIREAGVKVEYGKKFDRVVSETENSVTWLFTDGSQSTASLLVGADGIHSRVRSYIHPGLEPKFTNMIGVTAAVPTKQLKMEENEHKLPATFMHNKRGAFVIAPQLADGSEVLIGKQRIFAGEDPGREAWKAMTSDKTWCVDFLREGYEDFPPIVTNATSEISPNKVNLWPFYLLPKLDKWASQDTHSRVVILGDAAHAIPPTAGQGVNQAFEDVYTFAALLGQMKGQDSQKVGGALARWQQGRQERVDKVIALNSEINQRRLPNQDTSSLKPFDLDWLYSVDLDKMVTQFVGGN
ncbi:salicylate hydroxylase [Fusarium albosuccineum]|uniref:Salicylate hydroxylase n=1 Tax=Fusarium albosuccineum TaxID=1237068 RepID=A0A8H4KB17_9HYPO|nr:salicylate hydroxylase [Fusarium albosuccineum]